MLNDLLRNTNENNDNSATVSKINAELDAETAKPIPFYEKEALIQWHEEDINIFLLWIIDQGASDIIIASDAPIWARIHGNWHRVTSRPVITNEITALLNDFTRTSILSARLQNAEDPDFPIEIKRDRFSSVRFRCNATTIKSGISVVMRSIPSHPPLIGSLNPEADIMKHGFPNSGLVLVTGTMGSGKSTLLSSMIRHIIENSRRHVLTYESPIEFDLMSFENAMGICTQTEIPTQLKSFTTAPRNAARRAADVILVGESREKETFMGILEAAEIGTAAYTTVHTRSVADTPTRIINAYPTEMQNQVAITLLSSLKLIIQQRLVDRVGGGRVALREILAFNANMRDDLMSVKTHELVRKLQQYTANEGQTLMDDAKIKYADGLISKETLNVLRHEFS